MELYDNYKTLSFSREENILTVTLGADSDMAIVDGYMHYELSRLFYDLAYDNDTDIIVLTGTGKSFCAGGDINWLENAAKDPNLFSQIAVEAKQIIFGILDLEKPIVCRLNGDAVGLGATLALFCDIIIADKNARIGDLHVNVGLSAGDGGAIIWPQSIGYPKAKEFLMTGRIIRGSEAAEMGLINYAVESEKLDDTVNDLVLKLKNGPTQAIRLTKVSVNVGLKQLAHSMMDASISYEALTNHSSDHLEGIAAFKEKRRPKFTGK